MIAHNKDDEEGELPSFDIGLNKSLPMVGLYAVLQQISGIPASLYKSLATYLTEYPNRNSTN